MDEFDLLNREYYPLILKIKSVGPAIDAPSITSFQLFFMVCFDTDRFKVFLNSKNFRNVYALSDKKFKTITKDEIERLKFGYKLLRQILFDEEKFPLISNALDTRMEEHKEILQARRAAEVAEHQDKFPFDKYIDD